MDTFPSPLSMASCLPPFLADESELLYNDLFEHLDDGQSVIKTSFHELEDRIQQLTHEAHELRSQVDNVQSQNEKLVKQNEVLIRNISCLFKTAQMEIARKDKQIKSLQEENLKLSQGEPTPCLTGNARQSKEGMPQKTDQVKSKFPATADPAATDRKLAVSSVCNGTFRKRVRSGDGWQELKDEDHEVKEFGEERKPRNAESRKREESETYERRHLSQLRETDSFKERNKAKWDYEGKSRKERGSHDHDRKLHGCSKLATNSLARERVMDMDSSRTAERRSEHRGRGDSR